MYRDTCSVYCWKIIFIFSHRCVISTLKRLWSYCLASFCVINQINNEVFRLSADAHQLILEGVNGVNRLATKGEKISLTTDKTRKKLPTSDKKKNN